jgi:hypothetical protein
MGCLTTTNIDNIQQNNFFKIQAKKNCPVYNNTPRTYIGTGLLSNLGQHARDVHTYVNPYPSDCMPKLQTVT